MLQINRDTGYSEGPSELHFFGTTTYQATWGFGLRIPIRLLCCVFTSLASHEGSRWRQASFVCQAAVPPVSGCGLAKVHRLSQRILESGSLVSKLASPCLMESIYSIPVLKSGNF